MENAQEEADGPKGQIAVALADDKSTSQISVTVRDSGGGIPEDKLDSIFESFFTTKEVGQGMGLGLSVSQSIVSEMAGELSASASGAGTCFTLTVLYHQQHR